MANVKIERLNHLFMQEISMILMTEIKNKDINFVTITDVEITNDLSFAKIYYTTLNESKKEDVQTALNKSASFIRGKLSNNIDIRHTPELKFIYDDSVAYGEHIENIIKEINEK